MEITQKYLETLVAGQRRATRWYAGMTAATVTLGFIIVFAGVKFGISGDYLRSALTLGGALIASVAALPAKEIVASRNRIDVYTLFKLRLEKCSPEEAEQIRTTIWAAITKIASI